MVLPSLVPESLVDSSPVVDAVPGPAVVVVPALVEPSPVVEASPVVAPSPVLESSPVLPPVVVVALALAEVDASSVGPAFAAELLVFQIDLSHRLGRPEAAEKPFAELARLHIDYKTNMRVSSCFDEAQRRFGAPALSEM